MAKEKGMELIIQGSMAEFGQTILSEATKQARERVAKRVVSIVEQILQNIASNEREIKQLNKAVAYLQKKKAAIEKGEFSFDFENGGITFNDPELVA